MDLRHNINKIHGDVTNSFKEVTICEKSSLELSNYFELSILENNKEVKVLIKKTEIENVNFSWKYYANPLNENSDLVERTSSIHTFSNDIKDIFDKNKFNSDYKGLNEEFFFYEIGEKIISELDNAIKKFGSYSYHDKGASEIMELSKIVNDLNSMSTKEVVEVLKYILDNHNDSKILVDELISSLDNREDFDDILEGDDRFDY